MKMKTLSGLVFALGFAVSPALAHPRLTAAGPVPGSVIKTPPKSIRIEFSEAIELAFSGITLKDDKGQAEPLGVASLNPKDNKQLIVPVTGNLASGKYTVEWHALGDDTHPQNGRYNFEIKP